MVVKSDYNCY